MPTMSDSADDKKIIIDEDWKSQVEAEKEEAEATREASDAADLTGSIGSQDEKSPQEIPLPPADFTTIVSMLATQAMLNLGTLPNPMTGKTDRNLPQAKHAIDLVEVLKEKTKGNCNPQEEEAAGDEGFEGNSDEHRRNIRCSGPGICH